MFEGGSVTFEDNSKGRVVGFHNITISTFSLIENIVLVDGLKRNLLNIR